MKEGGRRGSETGANREGLNLALASFEDGGRARNAGGPYKLEKAREPILPKSLQKECSPTDTLILVHWDPY